MKNQINHQEDLYNEHISCGNCWGFQEWDGQVEAAERRRNNFIDSFVLRIAKALFK